MTSFLQFGGSESRPNVQYNNIHVAAATRIQKNWRSIRLQRVFKKAVRRMKRKNYTAMEMLTSERTYCEQLKFIITRVLEPSKLAIDDEEMHGMLFCNITQIYMLHHVFLYKFEEAMKDYRCHQSLVSVPMKELFTQQGFQGHYTEYCYNYAKADKIMKLLAENNSSFRAVLKESGVLHSATSLESYMIKPVQRLCKYQVMLAEYFKNTEPSHPDYEGIRDVISTIKQLADKTNSEVEQYLYAERFREIKFEYPSLFGSDSYADLSDSRRLVYENTSVSISLISVNKEEEQTIESMLIFNDGLLMLIPQKKSEKPFLISILHLRKVENMKYFKNLLQIVDPQKYYSFMFRTEGERDEIVKVIELKTNYLKDKKQFYTAELLGTERRESFFKFYTVYIIEINQNGTVTRIYPRFKNLLKIQEILMERHLFSQVFMAPLQKENPNQTRKSKTIEKRKFVVREFVERIVNNEKIMQLDEVRAVLEYFVGKVCPKQKALEEQTAPILIPNWQCIKVQVGRKCSKVRELKQKICQELEFIHSSQFEVFEVRNRDYSSKRLLYEDESVKEVLANTSGGISLNPFADKLDYMFSRHYYLSHQEELSLYQMDFIRLELELSVIKTEILTYNLSEDLMITFICLFAMYVNLPLENDRIANFIKDILTANNGSGKKTNRYKVSVEEFKTYYSEVEKIVANEEDELVTVPFLIIKILSNNRLYQCQQFEVEIHHKCLKQLRKEIPQIDCEHIILGLKMSEIMLLTLKEKHLIRSFHYKDVKELEMHPNGIIFTFHSLESVFRVKTTQSYEINKLVSVYKQKDVVNANRP